MSYLLLYQNVPCSRQGCNDTALSRSLSNVSFDTILSILIRLHIGRGFYRTSDVFHEVAKRMDQDQVSAR